jgi:plastocyanin
MSRAKDLPKRSFIPAGPEKKEFVAAREFLQWFCSHLTRRRNGTPAGTKEIAMSHAMWKLLAAGVVATASIGGGLAGCAREGSPPTTAPARAAAATGPEATQPAAAGREVVIDNFAFAPQVLTVAPGTRVTWVNKDDVPHTATSAQKPRLFNSGPVDTDEHYSHVFTTPGTYTYFCAVHPKMTATIIVK